VEDEGAALEHAARARREGKAFSFAALAPRLMGRKVFIWTLSYNWTGTVVGVYGDFLEVASAEIVFDHSADSISDRMAAGAEQFINLQHVVAFGPLESMPWSE